MNWTNGNITEIPTNVSSPARKLFWDFDNRLTGVDTTGDSTPEVTYSYDALGRRVSRTESSATVVYLSAGQQVVCDYPSGASPSSTPTYRYVWGDYFDELILRQTGGGTLHYYHRDQQFSTIGLTNSSGGVVERYAYTAYGVVSVLNQNGSSSSWSTNSNRYLYTGREWDNSVGMYYFRARWYEPLLGTFVGRDPLNFVNGQTFYQGHFELSGRDPSGLMEIRVFAIKSRTHIIPCGGFESHLIYRASELEIAFRYVFVQKICIFSAPSSVTDCVWFPSLNPPQCPFCLSLPEKQCTECCYLEMLGFKREDDGNDSFIFRDIIGISPYTKGPCTSKGTTTLKAEVKAILATKAILTELAAWESGWETCKSGCRGDVDVALSAHIVLDGGKEPAWFTNEFVFGKKDVTTTTKWDCCALPNRQTLSGPPGIDKDWP